MIQGILDYPSVNPRSGKMAIIAAVGFEGAKVGVQIGVLKKGGKIKFSGERSKMVHALSGEVPSF